MRGQSLRFFGKEYILAQERLNIQKTILTAMKELAS